MNKAAVLVAVVASLGAGACSAQQVFKCKTPAGTWSFQSAPCDGNGSGAIAVKPANTVDGKPAGEREILRSANVRAAKERGELVPEMTAREMRETINGPAGATGLSGASSSRADRYRYLKPCYSDQEVRNVEMEASSITRTPSQRRDAQSRADRMRECYR